MAKLVNDHEDALAAATRYFDLLKEECQQYKDERENAIALAESRADDITGLEERIMELETEVEKLTAEIEELRDDA